ncbi:MAG: MarR family transcriptional regulator [Bacteroidales bacterium]|nr:MarR family transcriptional regulator [Bacteroidales bacterium]
MEQDNLPLGMVVGQMMHEMLRVLKKRDIEKAEIPLTIEQHAVLHILNVKESDVILKEMADAMGKDKSAILRIIDVLEKKELVRRAIDQKDRRKKYLMVTKKGEQVIEEFYKIDEELREELKEGLTKEEMKIFYMVVCHIKKKAEQL